ncbi:hypothetical protein PL321_18940 [Caloramator sp. mosi_1]|uniref:hypothetical protein n=1 Tax=Caloramator sp. mosi_1 TaxID=3023090 RepID=UPI00235FC5CB|nr:hypothetical protein [Caloramator sp. mosi_1]WDC84258.1 hypothetical protein PL321_18940 [Caloramator sp. mosi_1]
MQETGKILTEEKLRKIVDLINNSSFINIYAIGSTFLPAQDLELKLDRIGKHCKSYNDKNLQYYSAKIQIVQH